MQVDVSGNHLSGLLIARPTAAGPRIVVVSYIGKTIIDYTLTPDSLQVNNSIGSFRHKKLENLIDNDFRIVFVDENRAKLKKQTTTSRTRKHGHFVRKTAVTINTDNNHVKSVRIKHPFIRLEMLIEPIADK